MSNNSIWPPRSTLNKKSIEFFKGKPATFKTSILIALKAATKKIPLLQKRIKPMES